MSNIGLSRQLIERIYLTMQGMLEMQKDREAWCAASYKESDMTEEMN